MTNVSYRGMSKDKLIQIRVTEDDKLKIKIEMVKGFFVISDYRRLATTEDIIIKTLAIVGYGFYKCY